jgi:hypothetical protein
MVQLFRALGALHVGEATDFSTRYTEVRGFDLPSGLGTVSTLQKVMFSAPARIGPFEPLEYFDGSIDNTAEIERWVETVVLVGPSIKRTSR